MNYFDFKPMSEEEVDEFIKDLAEANSTSSDPCLLIRSEHFDRFKNWGNVSSIDDLIMLDLMTLGYE